MINDYVMSFSSLNHPLLTDILVWFTL